jgi:hypothetical protein
MDLSTKTPVEIDTALAEIYGRYYDVQSKVQQHDAWITDMREGIAKFEAGMRRYSSYTPEALADLRARRTVLINQAGRILAEATPYEDEFDRRGGWTRFFLVQNNGGHIHSTRACVTCNKGEYPTRFGWLPELSGQTEAEAVAAHGAILCTVCYPSAPVEYTDRRDPSVCDGSGEFYAPALPHRTGYYSGNWGTCPACATRQTISKIGKIRKHKKAVS